MRASVWMEDLLWIISFYEGRNIHQTKNHFQVIIKRFINKCKLKLRNLFATIYTQIHYRNQSCVH